jgi:hypothetical protein
MRSEIWYAIQKDIKRYAARSVIIMIILIVLEINILLTRRLDAFDSGRPSTPDSSECCNETSFSKESVQVRSSVRFFVTSLFLW